MFGLERKHSDDELPIFVHVVSSGPAFAKAKQLWDENVRLLYLDKTNRKELIRFTYAKPACNAWLQRDEGTSGLFELILHWKDNDTTEVFVIMDQSSGYGTNNDQRLGSVLQAMLVTPSIVPAGSS